MSAEAEIGRAVAAYLCAFHWTVYQEVAFDGASGIADIVATQGAHVAVVECKTSFSLEVIAQARRWLPFAHWSWIAVPQVKAKKVRDGRWLGKRICEDLGIGVLEVRPMSDLDKRLLVAPEADKEVVGFDIESFHANRARPVAKPRLQRMADVAELRGVLRPEHQTFAAAGGVHGHHWSPFQETCRDVRDYLDAHGGEALLVDVVRGIHHHYRKDASARANLAHWAERGVIDGVVVERRGTSIFLRRATVSACATSPTA